MKKHSSRLARMRGSAAVEFAIVLIPLVTLVAGVAEFGHAIYQYEALTKATRDAARYLSTYLPTDSAYPLAQAQCLAVYGSTTCPSSGSGTELVSGLTTSMVVVCDSAHTSGCTDPSDPPQFANVPTYDNDNGVGPSNAAGSINLVEVKIAGYPYSPLLTYFNLVGLTFGNIVTVMRQVS
ncbi:pilus assembly protein TadG [Burkholderia sp. A27]|jgi:Flp pilus assembly protein TadG|nr:pilus assembly protein TadG [Paraburkholderia terricola]ORC51776.1 pilus assembly protein TadG [Burkholderia sp. A27]